MKRPNLRRRLVRALVAMVAFTVVAIGIISTLLLDRSLRSRLIEEAVTATEFNLAVLTPALGASTTSDPAALEASGLLDRFLLRGPQGATAQFPDGTLVGAGDPTPPVSDIFRSIVDRGEIAYEFVETAEGVELVTGARLSDGPLFTFTTSAAGLAAANQQMLVATAAAGGLAIAAGVVLALTLGRRLLRPVEAAQRAAETMAAGDLRTRLPVQGDDELAGLSSSFNDMATSLERTIGALEAARARERGFIADASHELRTPVTGLVNAVHLLSERTRRIPGLDADHSKLAALVEADVTRLKSLVDDLLELSRLDSDDQPPRLESVDLGAVLRSLVELHHPGAQLDCRVQDPVFTDRHAIERIVGNLLDNARKHAPGAGVVLECKLTGAELVIQVTDDGPGVPSHEIDHIFERFATIDGSRSRGVGLGLAIVARHVSRLGGTVVTLSPGETGLSVRVRLPVAQPLRNGDAAPKEDSDAGDESSQGATA